MAKKSDSLKLSRIYGTELDRVNCPFYYKIGACRHGSRCSRQHNKPTASPTILLPNMYQHPALQAERGLDGLPLPVDADFMQVHFSDFFEDVFDELVKYGDIEQMNICDNLGDHLVGCVYVKYSDEQSASRAMRALANRYYLGRSVNSEYSPVTDFREATCRQFEQKACQIGPYCNFLHIIQPPKEVKERTFGRQKRGRYDFFRPYAPTQQLVWNNRGTSIERQDRDMTELCRIREHSRERRRVFERWNEELDRKSTLWGINISRYNPVEVAPENVEKRVSDFFEEIPRLPTG